MTKLKFLLELEKQLSALPQQDIEEQLTFYCEMIEDRVEEGFSEEEAVAQIGSVEEIAAQILAEHGSSEPISLEVTAVDAETVPDEENTVQNEAKPVKSRKTWEIALLAVGSPLLFSLLIAALAVVFFVWISLWAVVVSLWAVFVSLAACAIALPVAAVYFMCIGYLNSGLAVIAASLVCGGLAIFFFYGCKLATKGMALLTKKTAVFLKNCIRRKKEA